MKTAIILTITLFTIANAFAQSNYYVDGIIGNDANVGTSLTTAWKTIQKACNSAPPNSLVQIKGGIYFENIEVNISGTTGNPITIKNYMNEVVLIDGTGTTETTMLLLANKNYLNFQNLTIQNRTVNDAQGILVETTGSNTSTDLSFKNITSSSSSSTTNTLSSCKLCITIIIVFAVK